MNMHRLNKTWIWGAGGTVIAAALVSTQLLSAQGMAPRKAARPAGMAPAAKAGAKAGATVAAKAAPKDAISDADKKLELARVGDVVITVGQLAERINRMSRYVRGRYQSLEKKRNLLDSMVEFEVLAKEAERRGFSKNPDVVRMLRQVMIQRLRQRVVEEKVKRADITDKDVQAYYDKHKNQYNKPETVRVSHILLATEAAAKKVLAEVKSKGNDPRAFRGIVQKYSTDNATKRRAGDLRYFTREDKRVPKPVIEAAFKLEKRGDVAGPIKSAKGWHIIKLTHRRKAINRKVDDPKVKQQIVTRILREKRREALDAYKKALRAGATVKIYDKRLADVKIDTTVQRRRGWRGPHGMHGGGRLRRGRPGRRGPKGRKPFMRRRRNMHKPGPMPMPMQ